MKTRILSLLIMALAAAGAAQASGIDPCLAGTVASVMAQGDCSIGDKVFNFNGYVTYTYGGIYDYGTAQMTYPSGMNSDNSAGAVGFLPLTDDPLAPGFRLTGSFWSSVVAPSDSNASAEEWAYLYFLVWTASGDARITGIAVAMNDWSLATSPDSACAGTCYSQAFDNMEGHIDSPYGTQYYEPFQKQYSGQPPSFEIDTVGSPVGLPASSASGWAYFETSAESDSPSVSAGDGSAYASFTWADYRITQSAPEPGSWLLLGAAWVPLLLWGRRARRVR